VPSGLYDPPSPVHIFEIHHKIKHFMRQKRRIDGYFLLATGTMKKLTVFAISHFIAHTEHNMSELREWQTLANKELSRREKPSMPW
jgi:methylmalonyl-CoA mutase